MTPGAQRARWRDAMLASRAEATRAGKIKVVRVAAGYDEDRTVEVHERDCPCLGCAQWRAA